MENIQFALGHLEGQGIISWEEPGFGYRVKVSVPGLNPTGMIYRRAKDARSMFGAGNSERDPNAPANRKAISQAQAFVRENDLVGIAVAQEAERKAEEEMRLAAKRRHAIARELGPQAIDALRGLVECFGQDALRGMAAHCSGLDEARELIRLADEGERGQYRCRPFGTESWENIWGINARSARDHHAFNAHRPGNRGPWLPDEIELEAGQ